MSQPGVARRVLARPTGWVPALWLAILVIATLFGEVIWPIDPNAADFNVILQSPSLSHPFGTDELGRDALARLMDASGVALLAGVQAVGIGVVLGVPLGLLVGYLGGWWDMIVMRLVDAIFSLPGLIFAFTIVSLLGPGVVNAMFAVGFLFSLRFVRLTRGSVLSAREEPYIEAARLSGAPTSRILRSYLLPNIAAPLIVQVSISLGAVLLIEAGLSFLGLGVQPPDATWGTMLREARLNQTQGPWLPWPPGLAITLTVLAFNSLGDRLRDVLAQDPNTQRVRNAAMIADAVHVSATHVSEPTSATDASVAEDVDAIGSFTLAEPAERDDPASETLLSVRDLEVVVPSVDGPARAVRGLSFDVAAGEVVALVGESGSGKTLAATAIAGLLPRTVHAVGRSSIVLDGDELVGRSDAELGPVRGSKMSMVFQDPMSSLNPSLTIGFQLAEPLRRHLGMSRKAASDRAAELLDQVGVPNPASRLADYPHQFSGGMAQRVMISMALAAEPSLLIADEPTTALDVTTQKQVLELLMGACEDNDMAMLFITHDLGVVAEIADRAVVMYAGEAVETGEVFELFADPRHPYTRALLGSVPLIEYHQDDLVTIPGRVATPDEEFSGCRFAERCSLVFDDCRSSPPGLVRLPGHARSARCVLAASGSQTRSTTSVESPA